MKFNPSLREKEQIFKFLPTTKEQLITRIIFLGLDEKYARSLIWNMKRLALIYTDNFLIKKV